MNRFFVGITCFFLLVTHVQAGGPEDLLEIPTGHSALMSVRKLIYAEYSQLSTDNPLKPQLYQRWLSGVDQTLSQCTNRLTQKSVLGPVLVYSQVDALADISRELYREIQACEASPQDMALFERWTRALELVNWIVAGHFGADPDRTVLLEKLDTLLPVFREMAHKKDQLLQVRHFSERLAAIYLSFAQLENLNALVIKRSCRGARYSKSCSQQVEQGLLAGYQASQDAVQLLLNLLGNWQSQGSAVDQVAVNRVLKKIMAATRHYVALGLQYIKVLKQPGEQFESFEKNVAVILGWLEKKRTTSSSLSLETIAELKEYCSSTLAKSSIKVVRPEDTVEESHESGAMPAPAGAPSQQMQPSASLVPVNATPEYNDQSEGNMTTDSQ